MRLNPEIRMFWGNDICDLCFYGNILTFINFIRGIEQELFRMGMQTRSELDSLHKKEDAYFKQTMEEALKIMNEQHQKVWYLVNVCVNYLPLLLISSTLKPESGEEHLPTFRLLDSYNL